MSMRPRRFLGNVIDTTGAPDPVAALPDDRLVASWQHDREVVGRSDGVAVPTIGGSMHLSAGIFGGTTPLV